MMGNEKPKTDDMKKMDDIIKEVGLKIKARRNEIGISVRQFAEMLGPGIAYSWVNNIENGKVRCSFDRLFIIAEKLGVDMNYLVGDIQELRSGELKKSAKEMELVKQERELEKRAMAKKRAKAEKAQEKARIAREKAKAKREKEKAKTKKEKEDARVARIKEIEEETAAKIETTKTRGKERIKKIRKDAGSKINGIKSRIKKAAKRSVE